MEYHRRIHNDDPCCGRCPKTPGTQLRTTDLENVLAFVATFIGQETCQAQNDVQLYYYIANTLDERGHLRVLSDAESYTM
jgi:hypothetical protein